jgi:hypothetical protein
MVSDAGGIINNSPTALGFESRVSEFTLSNGLHFVVLERHNAPVVSCHTHAKVGAFVEEPGGTGDTVESQAVGAFICRTVMCKVLNPDSSCCISCMFVPRKLRADL